VIGRPGDHSSRLARGELADDALAERLEAEDSEGTLRRREFLTRTGMLAGGASLASLLPADRLIAEAARRRRRPLPPPRQLPIDTFVVLMMENRSFDHYFGWHPEADARNRFSYPDPEGNQVKTFRLSPDFQGCAYRDPDHSWEGGRFQWNHGEMDGFVMGNREGTGSDEFAAGYYLRDDVAFLPHVADAYTLYDRWFTSLMSSTWPNRLYQWSAQSGGIKSNDSPFDAVGPALGDGLYNWKTIFNLALERGLSVRYYYSDLPFGAVWGRDHILHSSPVANFYLDAALGTLPNICFVDPPFLDGGGGQGVSADEHPHGDIRLGQAFMSDITHAFINSPSYRRGAMFIDYDEWGGFFDHVEPRFVPDDRASRKLSENFGMTGFRVPGIAISPYTRGGQVSHMQITHESILKLISYRFGLGFLSKRHRYATNIGRSFNWDSPDFEPPADLRDPQGVLSTPCPFQAARPAGVDAPHDDMRELITSGYLDRVGAKVLKATPDRIFREPDRIRRALDNSPE
jgi:phospholipase C